MKLTLKKLKNMKESSIFAKGTFLDSPEDINVAGTWLETRWVAVRGQIHDWAIYSQNPHYIGVWSWQRIKVWGDKIHTEEYIKKLVPCTDKAFEMYRH